MQNIISGKKLYRFMNSEAAILTLASGKLRVGKWSEFNDPFDFTFGIDSPLSKNDKKEVLEKFCANLQDKFGAICFSGEWDPADKKIPIWSDPLGWGHYSGNHRGAVLEFSADIADGFWPDHLWKINYSDSRPQFIAGDSGPAANGHIVLRKAGQNKSLSWAHENEIRLIVPLDDDRISSFNGENFLPIPEGFLTRIIIGFCSPLEKKCVRKLIFGKPYEQVPIEKTIMSDSEYRMELS